MYTTVKRKTRKKCVVGNVKVFNISLNFVDHIRMSLASFLTLLDKFPSLFRQVKIYAQYVHKFSSVMRHVGYGAMFISKFYQGTIFLVDSMAYYLFIPKIEQF